jgi:hypothetical protein
LPKPTESAARGLGVFHSLRLSFAAENSSDSDLGGRVDLGWVMDNDPWWVLTTYEYTNRAS